MKSGSLRNLISKGFDSSFELKQGPRPQLRDKKEDKEAQIFILELLGCLN